MRKTPCLLPLSDIADPCIDEASKMLSHNKTIVCPLCTDLLPKLYKCPRGNITDGSIEDAKKACKECYDDGQAAASKNVTSMELENGDEDKQLVSL